MGTTVTLPDGKTASFPAGMNQQQIQDALDADPTYGIGSVAARPGVPSAPLAAGLQGPATPPQPPSVTQKAVTGVENFGVGAAKGLLHSISSSDQWARNNLPTFMTNSDMGFGAPANLQHVQQMTVPTTPAQKAGKFTEQAGEFLVPGLGEDAAGAKLAEVAPAMGRFAEPVGRVLAASAGTGAVNKAQGGNFTTGAALGAAGSGVGIGLKALAPTVAEGALGVRGTDRAFGRTPGQAIIEDTNGIRPSAIAKSAKNTVNGLTDDLESKAAASSVPASTQPALKVIDSNIAKYQARNSPIADDLADLRNQLTVNRTTGAPIPSTQNASGILNLKRGVGDFVGRWPQEQQQGIKGIARNVYGALDSELDRAVPGADGLNQRISSLFPVAKRADAADLNAGVLQKSLGRLGRPTGAMIGSIAGAGEGYREGGTRGALVGGVGGLVLPEILASPTAQMVAARMLAHPTMAIQAGSGAALQANRKSLYK